MRQFSRRVLAFFTLGGYHAKLSRILPAVKVFSMLVFVNQAVQAGRWVVIEDIDRMPFELLSSIVPLLECGQITLPGRGEPITAARGFQLFGTRSTHTRNSTVPVLTPLTPPLSSFANLWCRVPVAALSHAEMGAVLARYVSLVICVCCCGCCGLVRAAALATRLPLSLPPSHHLMFAGCMFAVGSILYLHLCENLCLLCLKR